jgi:outer membrane protein insertion porin family
VFLTLRSAVCWSVFTGFLLASVQTFAFQISDIRVEGLQRVSAGTVFSSIPFNVGDSVDELDIRVILRELFKTGSFDDVQVARDGTVLVLIVKERPTIDAIEIEGNKAIKSPDLLEGLSQSGLAEGEIFKKVTLEHIGADLERQYVSQGRYDANIETSTEVLPRNRVKITIDVDEGKTSGIRHINIVGNTVYNDELLRDLMELKLPHWMTFYKKDSKYSREKLTGDLERLESWYLDRGYLNFVVESTQVSIAPNKEDVYVTINVLEGERYEVSNVEIAGELQDVNEGTIKRLLLVRPGQMFSRELISASEDRIERSLGNAGYTFASATGQPTPDEEGNTVSVKFFVDAGARAYVRRVEFQGNSVTEDEVLRREMRQMEGGWASTAAIEGSKIRLERLGFFKEVNVETPTVVGVDDQVDVTYTVEEAPSGSISATLGFSQGTGLILGLGYQEKNVFGTGNSVNVNVNYSDFQTSYNFSYFDPYFTVDGVSRGFNAFYRTSDFDERNIARYSTDSFGGGVNFGYPISEVSRIGFAFGYENTKIKEGVFPAQEISRFLASEGDHFDLVTMSASYNMSALNRGLLPTGGRSQSLSFEMTVPGSELEFYRVNYSGQIFFPLGNLFVLRLRTDLGYGGVYGDTDKFPFYKHFFAGGFGSVRGYEQSTLGPRSTPSPANIFAGLDPIGGNTLLETSAEILFRLPFVEDQRQMRSAIFVDAGNVFNSDCDAYSLGCQSIEDGELRYTVGIAFTWITGFAPLSFSLSHPINHRPGDEVQTFQFELGTTF